MTPRNFTRINTATTTVVKSGRGVLDSININTSAAGTTTVYDNTAASGTVIAAFPASPVVGTRVFNVRFSTGLTIVTAGTSDLTVSWE